MTNDPWQSPWGNNSNNGPNKKSRPNNGTSPWAGGGSGGSSGGGDKPPQFDEWSQQFMQQGLGMFNRFGPGRGALIGLIILLLLWLTSGFYQVGTTQLGVVMRFGEPQRVEQPGLRFHLPPPIESVLLPEVTLNRTIEIGFRSQATGRRASSDQDIADEGLMLTGDESVVQLNFEVLWQVDPTKVQDFLFNIRDPELTVKAAAESVMREIIGKTSIQAILTGGADIGQMTKEMLQATLNRYNSGILITQINLRERKPPDPVREAFDDVNRANSDKDTTVNEARTYARQILLQAEGEAARLRAEAEGFKQETINLATGQAARFSSVLQSYQASPATAARSLYLDTMTEVLSNANKIIVDGKNTQTFLPLQELLRNRSTTSTER